MLDLLSHHDDATRLVREFVNAGVEHGTLSDQDYSSLEPVIEARAKQLAQLIDALDVEAFERLSTALNPPLHPLGAVVTEDDPRNEANRKAVSGVLRLYFADSLSDRMTRHAGATGSKIGVSLTDRFVSQLELASALHDLETEEPELAKAIKLSFRDNWQADKAAQRLKMSRATYYRRLQDGLNLLIVRIWDSFKSEQEGQ